MDRARVNDITVIPPKTGFLNLFFNEGEYFGCFRFSRDWRDIWQPNVDQNVEKKLMHNFRST